MTNKETAGDPEAIAAPEADENDTEGHSMADFFFAREVARDREKDVVRNLKAREHEIQARAAQGESRRPHKR